MGVARLRGWLSLKAGFLANLFIVAAFSFANVYSFLMSAPDNTPPFVVWDVAVKTKVLKAGEPQLFAFSFAYNKRTECYPPDGKGDVKFRVWSENVLNGSYTSYIELDYARLASADPKLHYKESSVLLDPMPVGRYALQWHTTYECKGASRPLTDDGPMMQFEVQ